MSKLILSCNIATNKTTGLVIILADWHIQGLEADAAAIGHYSIHVFWGEVYTSIPVFDDSIWAELNWTASPVSIVICIKHACSTNIYAYVNKAEFIT